MRSGRWARLSAVLADAILDEVVVGARYDALPAVLLERYGAVADALVLPAPRDETGDDAIGACLRQLAAAN